MAAGVSPAATSGTPDLAVEFSRLYKQFGGTQALNKARLSVRRGTVHALLGGNGSGKSTTIKILAGVYQADAGELSVLGHDYDLQSYTSTTAQQAGLRFVHQDLGLFEELSIEENFALDAGYPRNAVGGVNWKALRKRVTRLLETYEIAARPEQAIHELRPADRTLVAIARALQDDDAGELVLVLDEPTASLAAAESNELLERVRKRADLGQTVIIVSHRLKEVLSVAHDFTIFRDGRVVGELIDSSPTEEELVQIMAGSLVKALRPTGSEQHEHGPEVLTLSGINSGPLRDVNLTVHEGEIVGIAGLVGSGRSSILQAIFGEVHPQSGEMVLNGQPHHPQFIDQAVDAGVGMVPEDRGRDAAFADRSITENLSVAMLKEYWATKWMSRKREVKAAQELINQFSIKVSGPQALFSSMSGGNQQKTVIARWLQRKPKLLLLDEPTQGVDVMSRADIYEVIRQAAQAGTGVLVASSDMSELHALCDRIVFLRSGHIDFEVQAADLSVDELTSLVLSDSTSRISNTDLAQETRS